MGYKHVGKVDHVINFTLHVLRTVHILEGADVRTLCTKCLVGRETIASKHVHRRRNLVAISMGMNAHDTTATSDEEVTPPTLLPVFGRNTMSTFAIEISIVESDIHTTRHTIIKDIVALALLMNQVGIRLNKGIYTFIDTIANMGTRREENTHLTVCSRFFHITDTTTDETRNIELTSGFVAVEQVGKVDHIVNLARHVLAIEDVLLGMGVDSLHTHRLNRSETIAQEDIEGHRDEVMLMAHVYTLYAHTRTKVEVRQRTCTPTLCNRHLLV